MAMSRKHYQEVALAVYAVRQAMPAFTQHFDGAAQSAADRMVGELSSVFARDNASFDRERFREACETGTCRGMRKVTR
jgi:hypothetical protein